MNIEPGSVIESTLRTDDLIPAFAEELNRHNPSAWLSIAARNHEFFQCADEWDYEIACETFPADSQYILWEDLANALDEIAPEGMYFGAHPGDGSDFGFWPYEDEL